MNPIFPRRSASFWLAYPGLLLYAVRRTRPAGALLLAMVGIGGVGAVYGRFCTEHGIPTEPYLAWRAWREDPHRQDWLLAALAHAIFAMPALILAERWRRQA